MKCLYSLRSPIVEKIAIRFGTADFGSKTAYAVAVNYDPTVRALYVGRRAMESRMLGWDGSPQSRESDVRPKERNQIRRLRQYSAAASERRRLCIATPGGRPVGLSVAYLNEEKQNGLGHSLPRCDQRTRGDL
jgi:hypothetical protein